MKFLNKLERMFGRFAIRDLMKYVLVLYGLGLIIGLVAPEVSDYITLDFDLVAKGQVWRLITFLIPVSRNIIWQAFIAYIYYLFGRDLERVWGAFRLNLYFLTGIIFNILAAFITYKLTSITISPSIEVINPTLFLAFAAIYPNAPIYLYFLLPIKAKYLAYIRCAFYAYEIFQYISFGHYLLIIPIVVSLANFLIFFFATRNYKRISPREFQRKAKFHRQIYEARQQGPMTRVDGINVITRHKCAVCGRTELDNDQLEFRFCSKCDGNYEYCMEHLFTHEHVKK